MDHAAALILRALGGERVAGVIRRPLHVGRLPLALYARHAIQRC